MTRRTFLRLAALAGAGLWLYRRAPAALACTPPGEMTLNPETGYWESGGGCETPAPPILQPLGGCGAQTGMRIPVVLPLEVDAHCGEWPTALPTDTATATATDTATPSPTATETETGTPTPSATDAPTSTATATATETAAATVTPGWHRVLPIVINQAPGG